MKSCRRNLVAFFFVKNFNNILKSKYYCVALKAKSSFLNMNIKNYTSKVNVKFLAPNFIFCTDGMVIFTKKDNHFMIALSKFI
jgi:hypothetical protein